ncbi:MAG: hypothetical protein P1V18_01720 [Candidatus Gracilibacteria bacterium]|nr:hypothetical protein [Candidatus Gracilibacteria bacterium]
MSYQEHISKLFLDIENEVGITKMDDLVLSSLCRAIHDYRECSEEDFFAQFYELFETIKNTQPRISLVIDHFFHLWKILCDAQAKPHPEGHLFWEKKILQAIKGFRKNIREEKKRMVKSGAAQIKNGDVILVHSLSSSVLDSLSRGKRKGKKFRVIIAEQEVEKTQKLIEKLTKSRISFQVVPEYMLTHIEGEVSKVFLGAVTLNSNLNIVGDAGMNAVVSEFHLRKTPVYLFMLTRKFSLWKSSSSHHRYKAKTTRTHGYMPITFERIKFSHDRVPHGLFDFFITEQGKMTSKDLSAEYQKRFKEREKWRKEFFKED